MSEEGGGKSSVPRWSLRPAVPVAAAYMLGIFAQRAVPSPIGGWLIGLGILIAASILTRKRESISSACVLLAIFVAGITATQIEACLYPRDHISTFAGDVPRLAQVEMRLDYPPRDLTAPYKRGQAIAPRQVATATILKIKTWSGWEPCSGQVLVQINQPNPRLKQGQIVRAIGRLERPGPAANPGQFDWAGYYREQRILASIRIDSAEAVSPLDQRMPGPISWLREQARRALARGFEINDSLDHALLRALLLGDNDPELRDVQEQFRRTGTSHHLAISGMHVAILGLVIFAICRFLQIGPRRACWIGLIAVVLYGIVALPSPPVVRSVLLCVFIAIGVLQRRAIQSLMLQMLAVSVIAMLVYHPMDIYNAGFQLSFGMVLGLTLFTPLVLNWLPGRDPDVEIAQSLQGPLVFDSPSQRFKRWARMTAAASIVAWVIAMPLIAIHFEQLNPWAIPASLLLAPFVFVALVGGFAKVLLTLLLPTFSSIWAGIAKMPIVWMRGVVDWLATFPGADVPLPAPPVWMVVLFYLLLLSLIIPWRRRWPRWVGGVLAIACGLMLVIVPLREGAVVLQTQADSLRVTFLSVGAGQCAVVEPPGSQAILIDAGSATLTDVAHKALGPFLRHQGRREIRSIFISHANTDHFSAVSDVVAAYDVPEIYVAPQFRRHSIDNPPAEALLRALDQYDRPPRIVATGQAFDLGGNVRLEVVWPGPDTPFDANNCSLVLRLNFAGKSILFTGDIQAPAMRELVKSPQTIRSDVLVAPHHGSFESTTVGFIDTVAPAIIVCSNDRTLSMKQHDFDRATAGRTVFRTHTSGAVSVFISPEGDIRTEQFLRPTSPPTPAPSPARESSAKLELLRTPPVPPT